MQDQQTVFLHISHTCPHYLALAWLQVGILVGKGGTALKKLGQEARIAIEAFLERKVRRSSGGVGGRKRSGVEPPGQGCRGPGAGLECRRSA